jgi:hypothetical protein
VPDVLALAGFAAIAVAVTVIALVESYTNLYEFFTAHGLHGWRASLAPGCVDAFILMGELLLFAAFTRSWRLRDGAWIGWLMAAAGFSVSVAGNVEHAAWASLADKATSAIFPVTAAAGLAGGLVIVKRVTDGHRAAAGGRPAAERLPASHPGTRRPAVRPPGRRGGDTARAVRVADLVTTLPPERVAELAAMSKRALARELDVTPWAAEVWLRGRAAVNGSAGPGGGG